MQTNHAGMSHMFATNRTRLLLLHQLDSTTCATYHIDPSLNKNEINNVHLAVPRELFTALHATITNTNLQTLHIVQIDTTLLHIQGQGKYDHN